ncbi:MAG: hypothetical protein ABUS79_05195 [Pseudomonadota bacterium]
MASFETRWNELRASVSEAEEKKRAEDLVAAARDKQITYQVALFDAANGAAIPIAELERHATTKLRVQVTVGAPNGKRFVDWEPRSASNVLPLLRE